jgi:hypothetical protein
MLLLTASKYRFQRVGSNLLRIKLIKRSKPNLISTSWILRGDYDS